MGKARRGLGGSRGTTVANQAADDFRGLLQTLEKEHKGDLHLKKKKKKAHPRNPAVHFY